MNHTYPTEVFSVKRMFAILLAVLLLVSMFSVTAFASQENVTSPEKGNTDVEVQPDSPQTGGLPVYVIAAACVVLGLIALLALKKALA